MERNELNFAFYVNLETGILEREKFCEGDSGKDNDRLYNNKNLLLYMAKPFLKVNVHFHPLKTKSSEPLKLQESLA